VISIWFLVLLLLWPQKSFCQLNAKVDSVNLIINEFMCENKVPGFAVSIIKDSAIAWSNAFGLADINSSRPMSIDAIINIASISKTITAAAKRRNSISGFMLV